MKKCKVKIAITSIMDSRPDPRAPGGKLVLGTAITVIYPLAESTDKNGWNLLDQAMERAKEDFPRSVALLRGFKDVDYAIQAVEVLE